MSKRGHLMCKYICLVESLQFYEIWWGRGRNVQNTVVKGRWLCRYNWVLSYAPLCYCVFLFDYVMCPVCARRNDSSVMTNVTRYFCQPDMTVGSHSDAEGGWTVLTTRTLGQIYRMCGGRERPQRFQLSSIGKNADWHDSRHGQSLPHSSSKSCAPPISTFKARQTAKHRYKVQFSATPQNDQTT